MVAQANRTSNNATNEKENNNNNNNNDTFTLAFTRKLLVLIELFSLDITAKALRAKIDRKSAISLQRGQFDPKF